MENKDPLEITILKANIRSLEEECSFQTIQINKLNEDVERYRKETERLQNLWFEALRYQIFPQVKVETITMKQEI